MTSWCIFRVFRPSSSSRVFSQGFTNSSLIYTFVPNKFLDCKASSLFASTFYFLIIHLMNSRSKLIIPIAWKFPLLSFTHNWRMNCKVLHMKRRAVANDTLPVSGQSSTADTALDFLGGLSAAVEGALSISMALLLQSRSE